MRKYRKINYHTDRNRTSFTMHLHPDLKYGLEQIAKDEKKSVGWLVEFALADYFGVRIPIKVGRYSKRAFSDRT